MSKDRISVIFCANADGSHLLQAMDVCKAKKPRCMKNIMATLSIYYKGNKLALFTQDITSEWFHKHAIPEIYQDQVDKQKIARNNVNALIFLDNVMFLPPNTTSVLQPMDHGIIECCKRYYHTKLMNECFIVMWLEEDVRGKCTLENIKNYNLRNAIFNLNNVWNQVSVIMLANGWKKLLHDTDVAVDFIGFDTSDFVDIMHQGVAKDVREEDIECLEVDADAPGFHHHTEEEIAASVIETN